MKALKRIKLVKFGPWHQPAKLVWTTVEQLSRYYNRVYKPLYKAKQTICGLYVSQKNTIYVAKDGVESPPEAILFHELVHHMDTLSSIPCTNPVTKEACVEERGRLLLNFILENKPLIQAVWKEYKIK